MVTFQLRVINETFSQPYWSLAVYGYTVSSETREVLSIVDKILICLQQFLANSNVLKVINL